MKKLILLLGLFLSCDVQHECVTVTTCGDDKTIETFNVSDYEMGQYDGVVIITRDEFDSVLCVSFTDCK